MEFDTYEVLQRRHRTNRRITNLVVVAEVRLRELERRESASRPGKPELGRDVAWTSYDVGDSLPTEAVDDERRTASNQQQRFSVRQSQVLDDIVGRQRRIFDFESPLGLDAA